MKEEQYALFDPRLNHTRIVIAVQRWMEERKKMADYIDRKELAGRLRRIAKNLTKEITGYEDEG